MKSALIALALTVSAAQASTHRVHEFTKGKVLNPETLGLDLAQALNSIKGCDKKFMQELDFAGSVTSLTYSSSRNGVTSYSFEALGERPAPSFSKYKVRSSIVKKIIRDEISGPVRVPQYTTTCKVEVENLE